MDKNLYVILSKCSLSQRDRADEIYIDLDYDKSKFIKTIEDFLYKDSFDWTYILSYKGWNHSFSKKERESKKNRISFHIPKDKRLTKYPIEEILAAKRNDEKRHEDRRIYNASKKGWNQESLDNFNIEDSRRLKEIIDSNVRPYVKREPCV